MSRDRVNNQNIIRRTAFDIENAWRNFGIPVEVTPKGRYWLVSEKVAVKVFMNRRETQQPYIIIHDGTYSLPAIPQFALLYHLTL